MFRIKMLCYQSANSVPYEDEPAYNPVLTEKEAYANALRMAKEECAGLNDNAEDGARFRVVSDQANNMVFVQHHHLKPNGSDTTDIEPVTTYFLEEVKVPASMEVYGFNRTHASATRKTQEIRMSSAVFASKEEAEEAAWKLYSKEYSFAKEYGLLQPTEEKFRRPAFLKELWTGNPCIHRTDLQVRFDGWSQLLKIGG